MSLWQRWVGGRPIVTRLVLAVAAAMTVILVLASGFVYWRVSYALNRQLNQDLLAWSSVVTRSVAEDAQPPRDTPGQTYQLYDAQGRLTQGNRDIGRLVDGDRLDAIRRDGRGVRYDIGRFLPAPDKRVYRVQLARVTTPGGTFVVASVISRSKHDEALRELLLQLFIADLLTLAGASLVGYRTARAALDPVEAYRVAAQLAGTEPGAQLPVAVDRDDELARLGHTFNDLLARIESSAVRERQFLADASHELRSPLALISTELEWARHRPRTAAELDQVLASLQVQVSRLVGLTNALLEVEELAAVSELPREPVPLPALVTDAVRDAVPADVPVRVDVPDVVVHVNPRWLGIALGNLLRNAVRHGGGDLAVAATWQDPVLRLVVSDSGPGFHPDFQPVAFDRFTRADRSRSTPGSGLGLHLVSAVARAHGGHASILTTANGVPGASIAIEVDGRGREASDRA